jgi:hypothetical protein
MEVKYTPNFEAQRKEFRFCFTCEHCAHFDSDQDICLHGYPNGMHLLSYYLATPHPTGILFCKDFDLG